MDSLGQVNFVAIKKVAIQGACSRTTRCLSLLFNASSFGSNLNIVVSRKPEDFSNSRQGSNPVLLLRSPTHQPSRLRGSTPTKPVLLTLSLPRVINFKFLLQPHQNITSHSVKNLAFYCSLRWNMIRLPILIISLIHYSLGRLGECTFWTWEWKG